MEDSQVNFIYKKRCNFTRNRFPYLGAPFEEENYPCSICCQQLRSATYISSDSRQKQTTRKSTNVAANFARNVSGKKRNVSSLRFSFLLSVTVTKAKNSSRLPNAHAKYKCLNK
ncbi:hypothetical protein CEXT_83481 [Caerostris extrusa]|uniref:Uncharacterized protein n=1 Tax=Caerostris extrusa TaxID=172846 RepID=A0AAV4Q524_CAEEX|nr:hypothetical protein CEXT_83481 [Caerostris extrusa]